MLAESQQGVFGSVWGNVLDVPKLLMLLHDTGWHLLLLLSAEKSLIQSDGAKEIESPICAVEHGYVWM